jgi:hypothetical protein
MSLNIPEHLHRYVTLTEQEDMINRFKCPVCNFRTRLGPGALRMHIILKSDPKVETQYDPAHEAYMKTTEFSLDTVKELAQFPRIELKD